LKHRRTDFIPSRKTLVFLSEMSYSLKQGFRTAGRAQ
jgi:hypothetical protein